MAKFEIIYTETVRFKTYIEAETVDEAAEKFFDGDFERAGELESFNGDIEKISKLD